jgi:hypothetical protein
MGTYGKDWKMYRRSLSGKKDSLIEYGPNLSTIGTGFSYWIRSYKNIVKLSADSGTTTPVSRNYQIVIPGKSWAAIGDPFVFAVGWKTILDSTGSAGSKLIGPYTYEAGGWIPPTKIDRLEPWRGYYVYNSGDTSVTMQIPSLRYVSKPLLEKKAMVEAGTELEWIVSSAKGRDYRNYFGFSSGAGNDYDAGLDCPKAGSPESDAPVTWFSRPEFGSISSRFQTDFTSRNDGGAVWTAVVGGLQKNARYQCDVAGLFGKDDSVRVMLVDRHAGTVYDARTGSYSFVALEKETQREIEIVAGSQDFTDRYTKNLHLLPSKLALTALMQRGSMLIRYSLPWSEMVIPIRIDMFDLRGRLIKTIVKENKEPGVHTAVWDWKHQGGASGLYFIRLNAGGKRLVTSTRLAK